MKAMKEVFGWLVVSYLLIWGAIELGSWMAEGDKIRQQEKEQCIFLKYEKEAEKFLDKDCQRYVRYKQDNE